VPIWTGGYDARTGELNTPPELSDRTVIRHFLSQESRPVAVSGLWSVGSGNYIVAARPILDSDGAGLPAGTIVFGAKVDDHLVAELREQTEVDFSIVTLPIGDVAEALRPDLAMEVARTPEQLTHSVVWHDLTDVPRIRIDVDTAREISGVGNNTIKVAMTLLIAAALVDMSVIGLAITLLVARPIRTAG
jgi:sensor domain CHASE-containing protein